MKLYLTFPWDMLVHHFCYVEIKSNKSKSIHFFHLSNGIQYESPTIILSLFFLFPVTFISFHFPHHPYFLQPLNLWSFIRQPSSFCPQCTVFYLSFHGIFKNFLIAHIDQKSLTDSSLSSVWVRGRRCIFEALRLSLNSWIRSLMSLNISNTNFIDYILSPIPN